MLVAEIIVPRLKHRRKKVRADYFMIFCPWIKDNIAFFIIKDTKLLILFLAD